MIISKTDRTLLIKVHFAEHMRACGKKKPTSLVGPEEMQKAVSAKVARQGEQLLKLMQRGLVTWLAGSCVLTSAGRKAIKKGGQ